MPNSPRGGGVSRKITSATDRKRLREVIDELSLPQGMSLIVRTAGAQRPKPEIRRDCEYLLRLWDNIRERTLPSTAPALIYEEADLIKRSHPRRLLPRRRGSAGRWRGRLPRGARVHAHADAAADRARSSCSATAACSPATQVEQQLDAMHSPNVQLRSGGYIVINQTEALVAIDVNSGRSTRERHIEDTAYRTNIEAADEIARQLRLRDLAGLIVIDFIDMESSKQTRGRAPAEGGAALRPRPHPGRPDQPFRPAGDVAPAAAPQPDRDHLRRPARIARAAARSARIESGALQVLRAIEEEGAKRRAAEIAVHVHSTVALYLLNRKRDKLAQIEARFGMAVVFEPDDTLLPPTVRIEKLRAADPGRPIETGPAALRMDYAPEPEPEEIEEPEAVEAAEAESDAPANPERRDRGRAREPSPASPSAPAWRQRHPRGWQPRAGCRRRGRGWRGRRGRAPGCGRPGCGQPGRGHQAGPDQVAADGVTAEADGEAEPSVGTSGEPTAELDAEAEAAREAQRRRRRGRRGRGAPNGREGDEAAAAARRRSRSRSPSSATWARPRRIPSPARWTTSWRRWRRPRPPPKPPRPPAAAPAPPSRSPRHRSPRHRSRCPRPSSRAGPGPRARLGRAGGGARRPRGRGDHHRAGGRPDRGGAGRAGARAGRARAGAAVPAAAPEPVPVPEPEPTPCRPSRRLPRAAAAEPEPAETVVQGPVVQPVSIDSLDEAAPRRRGWWKR